MSGNEFMAMEGVGSERDDNGYVQRIGLYPCKELSWNQMTIKGWIKWVLNF